MEDPAASKRQFRIRVMASHTRRDLDVLLEAIDEVWSLYAAPEGVDSGYRHDAPAGLSRLEINLPL